MNLQFYCIIIEKKCVMEKENKPIISKEEKLKLLQARIEKLKKLKRNVANSDKPTKKERTKALIQLGAKCFGTNWSTVKDVVLNATKVEVFVDGKKL